MESDPSQELQRRGRGCGLGVALGEGSAWKQQRKQYRAAEKCPIMLSASILAVDQSHLRDAVNDFILFIYFKAECFFLASIPLQTFVNDVRIQEQMYITLKLEDKLRFGYDILSLLLVPVNTHKPGACRAARVRIFDRALTHTQALFLTRLSHIPTCSRS